MNDLITSLDDDRLRKECLSLPMSTDTLLFYDSLKNALKVIDALKLFRENFNSSDPKWMDDVFSALDELEELK